MVGLGLGCQAFTNVCRKNSKGVSSSLMQNRKQGRENYVLTGPHKVRLLYSLRESFIFKSTMNSGLPLYTYVLY